MTNPKIKPCPLCKSEHVGVYKYDSGWQYVECDGPGCWYRGPGDGSIKGAIKAHNAKAGEPEPKCCLDLSPEDCAKVPGRQCEGER
jgi:hypothetical protein